MTVKLNDVSSGYSTAVINENFQTLEDYINDNLLNRDGTSVGEPNQMEVGLDMNSNFVYNLPEPVLEHQAARLQDVQNAISGDTNQANLILFTPYNIVTAENVQGAIQQVIDEADQITVTSASGTETLQSALNARALNADVEALEDFGFTTSLDNTGASDVSAGLQAALDSQDVVLLPPGDYKLSATVTLNSNNVLRGMGTSNTRIFRDTAVTPFDFFEGQGVDNVTISDLFLDSVQKETVTVADNRHCAIRIWDGENGANPENSALASSNITVRNVRFDYFTSAEFQTEGDRGVILLKNCNVAEVGDCQFYDNRATCIFWIDANNVDVHDNYCLGEQTPYDPTFQRLGSFTSGRAEGVSVKGNRIKDTGYTSLNVSGDGVVVANNYITSPAFSCITVNEGDTTTSRVTITGNVLHNPGLDGVSLFNVGGATISGNTIEAATVRAGIQLYVTSGGDFPQNVIITGNQLRNNAIGLRLHAGSHIVSSGNLYVSNGTGILCSNQSASNSSLFSEGDLFRSNTNVAAQLQGDNVSPQEIRMNGAHIHTDNIFTTQPRGLISQGSTSTLRVGHLVFNDSYDITQVRVDFSSEGYGLYALDSGSVVALKTLSGLP